MMNRLLPAIIVGAFAIGCAIIVWAVLKALAFLAMFAFVVVQNV